MRKTCSALFIMLLLGLPALAGTVGIFVDDPTATTGLSVDPTNALAVAWYQPVGIYANISVNFQPNSFGTGLYSAFLTPWIGPQTNMLDEVASTTFAAPAQQGWVNLFRGVPLTPGQYFLTIGQLDPNTYGGWTASTSATVTTGMGFTQGTLLDPSQVQFFATGSYPDENYVDPTYLPASGFGIDNLDYGQLLYEVSVPEPSTFVLIGGALVLLGLRRRRA